MLGIRTTHKEHPDCTPAQLVFGEDLVLPGQPRIGTAPVDELSFAKDLRQRIRQLDPIPVGPTKNRPTYWPKALATATSVFLLKGAHRSPLEKPYEGPFRVIRRSHKTFDILRNEKTETVSVDRLKPAFLPKSQEDQVHSHQTKHDRLQPDQSLLPTTMKITRTNQDKPYIPRCGRHSRVPHRFGTTGGVV